MHHKSDKKLLITVVMILTLIAVALVSGSAQGGQVVKYDQYVIQAGDTLWKVARTKYPTAHTGEMVELIRVENAPDNGDLLDPLIRPGQTILLPVIEK